MPDFIYCLNTSTIKPASLPDKIRVAREAGYAAIELWHEDVDAYLAKGGTLREIRTMLADRGLALPSMIYLKGWFETSGAEHAVELAECRRRMEQAAELESGICVAGPPADQADLRQGARHYRELLELGQTLGVRPAFEFLGFVKQYHTIEIAVEVLRAADHPDACVVVDPFHLYRGGSGIEGFAQAGLSHREIGILHFNDTPATPDRESQHDHHRVLPGKGHLDLARYLAIARKAGYHGALSLELFNPELWQRDPLEVARLGLESMRAVVEVSR